MFKTLSQPRLHLRTKEQFLEDLKTISICTDKHMVISFSRKSMGQTGQGHYSPIATYNPGRMQALVLDVARFKYPSYWAPVDLLWNAMEPHDPETNTPRGYFILSRGQPQAQSLCKIASECRLSMVGDIINKSIPAAIVAESPVESVDALVRIALSSVPKEHSFALSFVKVGFDLAGPGLSDELQKDVNKLIDEIKQNALYKIVEKNIGSCKGAFSININDGQNAQIHAVLGCIFLFACPSKTFANASSNVQQYLVDCRNSALSSEILRGEIIRLTEQITNCCNAVCCNH